VFNGNGNTRRVLGLYAGGDSSCGSSGGDLFTTLEWAFDHGDLAEWLGDGAQSNPADMNDHETFFDEFAVSTDCVPVRLVLRGLAIDWSGS